MVPSARTLMGIIPACAGNTPATSCQARPPRDHPRVCGEHVGFLVDVFLVPWIIPACAGNTPEARQLMAQQWDHPRVCGEHVKPAIATTLETGSSPRVRGTHNLDRRHGRFHGIIPACAGNTRWSGRRCCSTGDHPRVCGEHLRSQRKNDAIVGSSPRVRGTRFSNVFMLFCMGIIPACAGNTEK